MPLPTPQPGDVNVRGYILPPQSRYDVEALQSLYGQQPTYSFDPLGFFCSDGSHLAFAAGTDILFDLIAPSTPPNPLGGSVTAHAVNVRRA